MDGKVRTIRFPPTPSRASGQQACGARSLNPTDIEVRPYRPGDEDGILTLFNDVFGEDDKGYRARGLAHWRWEFLENPAGTQVVLGIEPTGRVIAQYACLPARVNLDGEDVCCGQGIDSVVHRDYRRGLKREGAFLKTARYYFDHYGIPEVNAFGYGFPNKKAYRLGVKLLDYKPIAAPVTTLARNLFNFKNDDEVALGADQSGEIVEVSSFGAEADALWDRLKPDLKMAIRRDAVYLNWRYAKCPSYAYRTFALKDSSGDWRGAVVTRANWMGPPILAVCELLVLPADTAAIARLLAHVVRLARETSQPRVEIWVPPTSALYDTILERGFKTEDSPFNLCLKPYLPRLTAAWARANWFYTIGDSDVF